MSVTKSRVAPTAVYHFKYVIVLMMWEDTCELCTCALLQLHHYKLCCLHTVQCQLLLIIVSCYSQDVRTWAH